MYSLEVLLSQFGTSLLFHVWFYLLLLDLHTDFSGRRQSVMVCPPLEEFFQFVLIHIIKGFGIVTKVEIDVFLDSLTFLMIQQMLAIWFLVPLPFLKPA